MPGVTFKISDDCYSLDIGQLDWIAAQREQEPTTGVGTLMGTDGNATCRASGLTLTSRGSWQFREWGATKQANCPREKRKFPFLEMLVGAVQDAWVGNELLRV